MYILCTCTYWANLCWGFLQYYVTCTCTSIHVILVHAPVHLHNCTCTMSPGTFQGDANSCIRTQYMYMYMYATYYMACCLHMCSCLHVHMYKQCYCTCCSLVCMSIACMNSVSVLALQSTANTYIGLIPSSLLGPWVGQRLIHDLVRSDMNILNECYWHIHG